MGNYRLNFMVTGCLVYMCIIMNSKLFKWNSKPFQMLTFFLNSLFATLKKLSKYSKFVKNKKRRIYSNKNFSRRKIKCSILYRSDWLK